MEESPKQKINGARPVFRVAAGCLSFLLFLVCILFIIMAIMGSSTFYDLICNRLFLITILNLFNCLCFANVASCGQWGIPGFRIKNKMEKEI